MADVEAGRGGGGDGVRPLGPDGRPLPGPAQDSGQKKLTHSLLLFHRGWPLSTFSFTFPFVTFWLQNRSFLMAMLEKLCTQ